MKKITKRLFAAALAVCMIFALNVTAFAADKTLPDEVRPVAEAGTTDSVGGAKGANGSIGQMSLYGQYIDIFSPADKAVYYQGEKINYKFKSYDTWTYYYTRPYVNVENKKTRKTYYQAMNMSYYGVVTPNSYDYYSGTINTKNMPVGNYTFGVMHFAYASRSSTGFTSMSNNPIKVNDFKLVKLKAPASVKATAGKKSVTVKFSKASGAQKYYIYRATSKNGKYSKIASTSKLTYTDKSVSKGKTYYYKVKSVRTKNGTITSSYCGVGKSGKVK